MAGILSGFLLELNPVIFLSLLLFPFVYIAYYVLDQISNYRKRAALLSKIPHPPTHWFWGHLHIVSTNVINHSLEQNCM